MNKKIICFGVVLILLSTIIPMASSIKTENDTHQTTFDSSGITILIECYGIFAYENPLHPYSYEATITITKENGKQIILTDEDAGIWRPLSKYFGIALPHGKYNVHCYIDSFMVPCEDEQDVVVDGHELVSFNFLVLHKFSKNCNLVKNMVWKLFINKFLKLENTFFEFNSYFGGK
jgi:hypothetical protein